MSYQVKKKEDYILKMEMSFLYEPVDKNLVDFIPLL
jgi:hypothetical protein